MEDFLGDMRQGKARQLYLYSTFQQQGNSKRKKEAQPRVPHTTKWRNKKRAKEEARARRKGWPFHQRKAYTCQLCGMPKTNQYGHASRNGKRFCSIANSGKSPEQWLSEQRAAADD